MKCPMCKHSTGTYIRQRSDGYAELLEYPLYQRSYPGELEYFSPRCSRCFDERMNEEIKVVAT